MFLFILSIRGPVPAGVARMRIVSLTPLLLLLMVFMPAACGKKGPPMPPLLEKPPAVTEIETRMEEGVLTLSWSLEPYRSAAYARPAGFRVYRSIAKHGDIECPGCPPRFQAIADILFDEAAASGLRAAYSEELEAGYRYRFRVIPYMDDGAEAGPSDIITIDR